MIRKARSAGVRLDLAEDPQLALERELGQVPRLAVQLEATAGQVRRGPPHRLARPGDQELIQAARRVLVQAGLLAQVELAGDRLAQAEGEDVPVALDGGRDHLPDVLGPDGVPAGLGPGVQRVERTLQMQQPDVRGPELGFLDRVPLAQQQLDRLEGDGQPRGVGDRVFRAQRGRAAEVTGVAAGHDVADVLGRGQRLQLEGRHRERPDLRVQRLEPVHVLRAQRDDDVDVVPAVELDHPVHGPLEERPLVPDELLELVEHQHRQLAVVRVELLHHGLRRGVVDVDAQGPQFGGDLGRDEVLRLVGAARLPGPVAADDRLEAALGEVTDQADVEQGRLSDPGLAVQDHELVRQHLVRETIAVVLPADQQVVVTGLHRLGAAPRAGVLVEEVLLPLLQGDQVSSHLLRAAGRWVVLCRCRR